MTKFSDAMAAVAVAARNASRAIRAISDALNVARPDDLLNKGYVITNRRGRNILVDIRRRRNGKA